MDENSSAYDANLQRMLDAQSKIKEINEARQADGEEKPVNKEDNDLQLMEAKCERTTLRMHIVLLIIWSGGARVKERNLIG